jgi:hypothetical protein
MPVTLVHASTSHHILQPRWLFNSAGVDQIRCRFAPLLHAWPVEVRSASNYNGRRKPSTVTGKGEPSYEEIICNPRKPLIETDTEESRSQEEPSYEEVISNPRETHLRPT